MWEIGTNENCRNIVDVIVCSAQEAIWLAGLNPSIILSRKTGSWKVKWGSETAFFFFFQIAGRLSHVTQLGRLDVGCHFLVTRDALPVLGRASTVLALLYIYTDLTQKEGVTLSFLMSPPLYRSPMDSCIILLCSTYLDRRTLVDPGLALPWQ